MHMRSVHGVDEAGCSRSPEGGSEASIAELAHEQKIQLLKVSSGRS